MSDQKNAKPAADDENGATITIRQLPEGLTIGLEFHGQNLSEDQRKGMKALVLTGIEAMREWIHERYSVRDEVVVRRPDPEGKKTTTH